MRYLWLVMLAGCVGQVQPDPTPEQRQEATSEVQKAITAADKAIDDLHEAGVR